MHELSFSKYTEIVEQQASRTFHVERCLQSVGLVLYFIVLSLQLLHGETENSTGQGPSAV